MTAFLIVRGLGWGKGKSLTEAKSNYKKYNDNLRGKYQLCIFDCPSEEAYQTIQANEWEYVYSKDSRLLYKGIEA
jgi:hypothetical protein